MTEMMICKAKAEGRCEGSTRDGRHCNPHPHDDAGCWVNECYLKSDVISDVTCIPYNPRQEIPPVAYGANYKEAPMKQYDLLKPISIKALEEAGACERELHRFAFLMLKNGRLDGWNYTTHIDEKYALEIASQCEGGIRFLLSHGFIKEREPEPKPCPFCGSSAVSIEGLTKYFGACAECRAETGEYETKASALEAWNKRA